MSGNNIQTDTISELRIIPEKASRRVTPGESSWRTPRSLDPKVAARPGLPASDTPILVVTGSDNRFGGYYAEILRAEGLNLFTVTDVDDLSSEKLTSTDVVILTVPRVDSEKIHQLATWVNAGGNLIAMRPEGDLLPLLGLGTAGNPSSTVARCSIAARSLDEVVQETFTASRASQSI